MPTAPWHKKKLLQPAVYVVYTNTVTHRHTEKRISFTHSADIHTPAEHSFEPAAEIQVALDHFAMVFISICLFSTSFFLFRGLFTASSVSLTTPHLFSLLLSSHFLSLFSLSEESDRGVWNASVFPCVLWAHLVAGLYFPAKLSSIYIAGPVVTLHKHMPDLALHILWAHYNWIYLLAQGKCAWQPVFQSSESHCGKHCFQI